MELEAWFSNHQKEIAHRWRASIRAREDSRGEDGDGFLGSFLEYLVGFVQHCFGRGRDVGEEVWHQATHLYGTLALRRGLAAGEVMEEFHLLREVLLRLLLEDPPRDWRDRRSQRDLLALNRVLDQGVVQASVAYVDELFFTQLQGSGVPERVTPELEKEIIRQLQAFQIELEEWAPSDSAPGG